MARADRLPAAAWGVSLLVLAMLADSVTLIWGMGGPTPVPMAPFLPALPTAFVGLLFVNRMASLEAGSVGRHRQLVARGVWAVTAVAATVAGAMLAAEFGGAPSVGVVGRNACVAAGLSLMGAVVFGARLSWVAVLPPTLVSMSVALAAVRHGLPLGRPSAWAVALNPVTHLPTLAGASAVGLLGILLYTWLDARPATVAADDT